MIARRQHYVWQKYLEAWATPSRKAHQLWCLRKTVRHPFCVDTKNVAVQRDFYRLEHLTQVDVDYVRVLSIRSDSLPKLRKLNEGWIDGFAEILRLNQLAGQNARGSAALREALAAELIEMQERMYSQMEGDAVPQIEALVRGDTNFFNNDEQAISFSYFLAHQYFRTKAKRDRVGDS